MVKIRRIVPMVCFFVGWPVALLVAVFGFGVITLLPNESLRVGERPGEVFSALSLFVALLIMFIATMCYEEIIEHAFACDFFKTDAEGPRKYPVGYFISSHKLDITDLRARVRQRKNTYVICIPFSREKISQAVSEMKGNHNVTYKEQKSYCIQDKVNYLQPLLSLDISRKLLRTMGPNDVVYFVYHYRFPYRIIIERENAIVIRGN